MKNDNIKNIIHFVAGIGHDDRIDMAEWRWGRDLASTLYAASGTESSYQMAEARQVATEVAQLIISAQFITIIDDGKVRYPVCADDLYDWIERNGAITDDTYEDFCATVDNKGESIARVLTDAMDDLCSALVDEGAATLHR